MIRITPNFFAFLLKEDGPKTAQMPAGAVYCGAIDGYRRKAHNVHLTVVAMPVKPVSLP